MNHSRILTERNLLWGVVVGLLVIGVVSGTIIQHLVQLVPIFIAVGMFYFGRREASSAALPLFAFWFVIMALVWLTVFGVVEISGTFTPVEIAVTVPLGIGCIIGASQAVSSRTVHSVITRLLLFALFGLLQIAFFVVSFSSQLARD